MVLPSLKAFAVMPPTSGPAVFRLEEHVDRLLDSALIVGFRDLPWTRDTLIDGHSQDDRRQ